MALGNMKGFVQNRNQSYEDLKAIVPKTGTASNTKERRSKDDERRIHSHEKLDTHNQHRQHQGQGTFYDTDPSNAAESSIGAEMNEGPNIDARISIPRVSADYEVQSEASGSEANETDYDEDQPDVLLPSNNGPRQLGGQLSESQVLKMQQRNGTRNHQKIVHGSSLPHMKGDTYPPTTSGRRSSADSMERNVAYRTQQSIGQATNDHLQAPAAPGISQAYQAPRASDRRSSTVRGGLIQRHGDLDPAPHTGFEWGKVGKPQTGPKNNSTSKAVSTSAMPSNNTATIDSTVNGGTIQQSNTDQKRAHDAKAATTRSLPDVKSRTTKRHPPRDPSDATADNIDGQQISDQISHTRQHRTHGASRSVAEDRAELDYGPEKLFKMEYEDLKALPFDEDPNVPDTERMGVSAGEQLEMGLDNITSMTEEEQSKLFATMSIDQWEQAGDWFITRFGDVLDKLKQNRQRKREASRAFESEVEKRNIAVNKKRKQTEDELIGMKTTGRSVLDRTPKKSR